MNLQAFTLAFTLWLQEVQEDEKELYDRHMSLGIGERAEEMAVAFDGFLKTALTQLGEPYADAATSVVAVHSAEDNQPI